MIGLLVEDKKAGVPHLSLHKQGMIALTQSVELLASHIFRQSKRQTERLDAEETSVVGSQLAHLPLDVGLCAYRLGTMPTFVSEALNVLVHLPLEFFVRQESHTLEAHLMGGHLVITGVRSIERQLCVETS